MLSLIPCQPPSLIRQPSQRFAITSWLSSTCITIRSLEDGGRLMSDDGGHLLAKVWLSVYPLDYSRPYGPLPIPTRFLFLFIILKWYWHLRVFLVLKPASMPSSADVSRYCHTHSHRFPRHCLHSLWSSSLCSLPPHFHVVRFWLTTCTNMVCALVCAHPSILYRVDVHTPVFSILDINLGLSPHCLPSHGIWVL